jgi:hypothetical protein
MNQKQFIEGLQELFSKEEKMGKKEITVNAGNLHRLIGGYPSKNHRIPVCCSVMRQEMKDGDTLLKNNLKKDGASLTIIYKLPR